MPTSAPKSLDEIKPLPKSLRNVNIAHHESLKKLEKLALFITNRVGSMGFFLFVFAWTALWLSWNTLAPQPLRFDPFPAFVLWLFISNVIQLMLMPLIMVGQNLQGRHSEARAESDFNVNVKAENEIEVIIRRLENQNQLILKILRHLEERAKLDS
ncbi:MAG: hypothetical protein NVS9B13_06460 [Candidatus Acidiferrum sp.]